MFGLEAATAFLPISNSITSAPFSFTITIQLDEILSSFEVALITAIPLLTPVIFPFSSTLTMFESDDSHLASPLIEPLMLIFVASPILISLISSSLKILFTTFTRKTLQKINNLVFAQKKALI